MILMAMMTMMTMVTMITMTTKATIFHVSDFFQPYLKWCVVVFHTLDSRLRRQNM